MLDYIPWDLDVIPSGRFDGFSDIFAVVLNLLIGVGIAVTLIGIILAGISYITARGDFKAIDKAKHNLTYAIIGLVLVLGSFTIKTILLRSLGVTNPVYLDANVNF